MNTPTAIKTMPVILPLEERERLRNRSVMRPHDAFLRRCIRNAPEHARRLRNRERKVVPGNRSTPTGPGLVRRVRASERLASDWIAAHPDQKLELRFSYRSAVGD